LSDPKFKRKKKAFKVWFCWKIFSTNACNQEQLWTRVGFSMGKESCFPPWENCFFPLHQIKNIILSWSINIWLFFHLSSTTILSPPFYSSMTTHPPQLISLVAPTTSLHLLSASLLEFLHQNFVREFLAWENQYPDTRFVRFYILIFQFLF